MTAIRRKNVRTSLISGFYTSAIFLSAALIFWVEPMVPKAVLPFMGGTPATWVTALMYYEAILFFGYFYSFLLTRRFSTRSQAVIHLVVLVIAGLALPPTLPRPLASLANMPVLQVLYMLAGAAGLPLFALSATAPLLQHWFARTSHAYAGDPYFLYAASNIGGLGALGAYPTLVEPHIGLASQGKLWTAGFGLVALTIGGCIFLTFRSAFDTRPVSKPDDTPHSRADTARLRLLWVLLAAVPSSLLAGTTTRITTNIAAGPLFWVIPLAVYLLSFVLAFSRRRILPMRLALWLQVAALVPVTAGAFGVALIGPWQMVGATVALLFLSAYICDMRLVDSRPAPERITEFYLLIALGGLLGGAFNALVAPNIFKDVTEYPLALILAVALRPPSGAAQWKGYRRDLLIPLGAGIAVAIVVLTSPAEKIGANFHALGFILALGLIGVAMAPIRFAAGLAIAFVAATQAPNLLSTTLYQGRNFYGVIRVSYDRAHDMNTLVNGAVVHGEQLRAPGLRRRLTTYYSRGGPFGDVISVRMAHQRTDAVAAIGLGAGTVACSGFSGAQWTFYEINPADVRVASDPHYFSFLSDCEPDAHILIGDGRLLLAKPPQRFDLIVLDAFSSDAIPMHLLTLEAFSMYLQKLQPGGMIAINVSNKFVNLSPVLAAVAKRLNLAAVWRFDGTVTESKAASKWVVMAQRPQTIAPFLQIAGWNRLEPSRTDLWTDDKSDLFPLLQFRSDVKQ